MAIARILIFLPLALCIGCATTRSNILSFQPLTGTQPKSYPPTDPQSVGIYRVSNPFPSFKELGLISYRTGAYDIVSMYDQLRKDSSEYGAQAVVGIKVTKETHEETTYEQRCTPETTCNDNGCTTQDRCETKAVTTHVSTFLITGSMIRRSP